MKFSHLWDLNAVLIGS